MIVEWVWLGWFGWLVGREMDEAGWGGDDEEEGQEEGGTRVRPAFYLCAATRDGADLMGAGKEVAPRNSQGSCCVGAS